MKGFFFSMEKNYNIFTKRFANRYVTELCIKLAYLTNYRLFSKYNLFPKFLRKIPSELKGNLSVMQRCLPIIY